MTNSRVYNAVVPADTKRLSSSNWTKDPASVFTVVEAAQLYLLLANFLFQESTYCHSQMRNHTLKCAFNVYLITTDQGLALKDQRDHHPREQTAHVAWFTATCVFRIETELLQMPYLNFNCVILAFWWRHSGPHVVTSGPTDPPLRLAFICMHGKITAWVQAHGNVSHYGRDTLPPLNREATVEQTE